MRTLIILPAVLLAGCILVPHHRHDHSQGGGHDYDEWEAEDDWEDREDWEDPSEIRGVRSGTWLIELSAPDLHGDCSDVDLGGTTEATLEVELLRDGTDLIFHTGFGSITGSQDGPEIVAFGTIDWEGTPVELELEAQAVEEVYLEGLVLGWSGPCLVAAQVIGSYIGGE
ncbi:MAG: hypothetical protein ACI8RZ_002265 [Myxococcota bacterium]|jgi:hypothetical protein